MLQCFKYIIGIYYITNVVLCATEEDHGVKYADRCEG